MSVGITNWTADGVSLSDYCSAVIDEAESGGGKRGRNLEVAGIDGERFETKRFDGSDIILRTVIRYTNPSGVVTHADGPGGHFFENMSAVKRLLGGRGPVLVGRTVPHIGAVRAYVDASTISEDRDRGVYRWVLRNPDGSWQSVTQDSAAGAPPSVTTGGDRRIHDAEFVFSAAGTITHTDAAGDTYSITVDTGPTFPVTVSRVLGVWQAVDNLSADAGPYVTLSDKQGIVLEPGVANVIAATVSMTVRWRNRWA